jgi:transcriptional regulator with PAS, ATPase and Fis domain
MNLQQIKQRFGIIGNAPGLNRALEVAAQVAETDISVLVTGESGTGKEIIPQVIHQLSARKHKEYIAVNCGAIPEGTIDSELFGHEKGSFTGAAGSRQGYFEVADGGTIFLDEVAELPMQTQVRLLRVLETGEFIRVGSSKAMKCNVRVVAATNENMSQAIANGKFREDLLYRLSTVPIQLPALRQRKEDINLLFRKFANDFAEKYRMPSIKLDDNAQNLLQNFNWPGNIRQLKNLVEQISVIEKERDIDIEMLRSYLPIVEQTLPTFGRLNEDSINERDLMYKFLFDMKSDLSDLKKLVVELLKQGESGIKLTSDQNNYVNRMYNEMELRVDGEVNHALPQVSNSTSSIHQESISIDPRNQDTDNTYEIHEEVEESLSLEDREKELILKALERHKGRRKNAALELGISERTLYRKINEYELKA